VLSGLREQGWCGSNALALSLALPPAPLWSLAAMSGAYLALVAAAYLIAGFTVPIGLIVAFDPHFRHAAAAPAARLRAMLIATNVLSLALFGGPLALPITLLGRRLSTGTGRRTRWTRRRDG
jgi:hypothetical protein